MVLKKTCWLAAIHPSRVGAMIGTRGEIDLEPFVRFGFFLGAAFQIQDDLLNLVADDRYGKELDGDIWEGKRTLMLSHAYRKATPKQRVRIAEILGVPREVRTADQVKWIRGLMDDYGSIDYACGIAHGLAGAALHEYAGIYDRLPETPRQTLHSRLGHVGVRAHLVCCPINILPKTWRESAPCCVTNPRHVCAPERGAGAPVGMRPRRRA